MMLSCVPNPFNPQTTIRYELAAPTQVNLRIYDIGGRLVNILKNASNENAGLHETIWRGTDAAGQTLPSGVYLCVLRADDTVETQSIVLVK